MNNKDLTDDMGVCHLSHDGLKLYRVHLHYNKFISTKNIIT